MVKIKENKNYDIKSAMNQALFCIIILALLYLTSNTFYANTEIITKESNQLSKQEIISELAISISSHDYNYFNSDIKINNHIFKRLSASLLLKTFSNKTIIFFGDSTSFKFYVFIVWCLDHYIDGIITPSCQFDSGLLNQNYEEWAQYASVYRNISDLIKEIPNIIPLKWYPNTLLYDKKEINSKLYLFENRWDYDGQQLFDLYHSWINYKPNIIFWNPFGLHLLHLTPLRPFQTYSLDIIYNFHNHLKEIYSVAMQSNAIMIYRGTSPLCYCADNQDYKEMRDKYRKQSHDAIMQCVDNVNQQQLHDIYQGMNLSIHAIDYCQHWTFMNEGALYQNQLIKDFVTNTQKTSAVDNIYFYDRFQIFHEDPIICCNEAGDTTHWLPSYGADAMYLANVISFIHGSRIN